MATSCDPNSLAQSARCFKCLAPETLLEIQVMLLCQVLNGAGGGGSSGGGVFSGNYAGGQPNFTPTTTTAIAIDTSNGTQWNWYNNTWN